jgi:hypothetical protein
MIMRRRNFTVVMASAFTLLSFGAMERARALTLADLTNADASKGLKIALEKGALSAVSLLGVADGFMGNDKVRIPLPGVLNDAVNVLRTFGQGGRVDELILALKFLPVVTQATEKVGLAAKYNEVAGKAAELGLMKKEDANIQQYVTGKTLDALFLMISEEEKKIRTNPVGYGSAILTKVFGALR